MKIKHIVVYGLLVVITLSGCSQGNSVNSQVVPAEAGIVTTQTADPIEATESSELAAQSISFSAGNKMPPPIDTPKPMQNEEPSAMAAPEQTPPGKSVARETTAPTPKPNAKPTVPPNPTTPRSTVAPAPVATSVPVATTMPTAIPTPMTTAMPIAMPTPAPTAVLTPEPPVARTICNTCGADITGNVPAHGDSHLLNGENFSYRVE